MSAGAGAGSARPRASLRMNGAQLLDPVVVSGLDSSMCTLGEGTGLDGGFVLAVRSGSFVPERFLHRIAEVGATLRADASGGGARLWVNRDQLARLEQTSEDDPETNPFVRELVTVVSAYGRRRFRVPCRQHELVCGARPLIMGVINCTPDSFFTGSSVRGQQAVRRAEQMVRAGADVIDIGGESTRPGSEPVSEREELQRVVPVVQRLADSIPVPVSVDTTKATVAEAAIQAGAAIINDISALAYDPDMAAVVARSDAALVLMHMRGEPARMYERASYRDVVVEVVRELRTRIDRATDAGIEPERLIVDPGIGFAKRAEHSLALLHGLGALRTLGHPVLVGPSRKSFIGAVLDLPPEERLEGTAAAVAAAVLGGAHILRVHDVGPMRRVADMAGAIRSEGAGWAC